jgi:hypothetical protein
VTLLLATAGRPAERDDDEGAARFWDAIDEEFLAVIGWDPARHVVRFPQDHPLLGWKQCPVSGCGIPSGPGSELCTCCDRRWASR